MYSDPTVRFLAKETTKCHPSQSLRLTPLAHFNSLFESGILPILSDAAILAIHNEEMKRRRILESVMKLWRQRRELQLFLGEIRAELAPADLEEAVTGQVATWLKWADDLVADLDPVSELIEGLAET